MAAMHVANCASLTFGRRTLLQAGLLGLGLPDLLRAEPEATATKRADSCIFIVQYGGASHIDTLDPKPNAADDIRGPYQPIATKVPGFQVTNMLPRLADLADQYAVIRSMTHTTADHNGGMHVCMTGLAKPKE